MAVYPIITSWGPGCWRQIDRFLREHRPDVLHIQYQAAAYDLTGWVNWLPWRLRRRQGRPRTVVTFHDLRVPYMFPKAGRLRQWSILGLARHADAVITTNAEDEQALRRHAWATHVERIPLGSNIEAQPPAGFDRDGWRRQLGMGDSQVLLAYFGFLNQSKGGEELVLTLDRLLSHGHDARLLMIGGQVGDVDATNRAYLERVRSLIRERGLDERVRWTGHTSAAEVSANLLAADVVVMPYRDGVSFRRTTFIAALRHGCAVVTTPPAVALPELRPGENVLLAPAGDVEALAVAVAQLVRDAALTARLRAGAQALGRTFDWSEIARRTWQVYAGLAEARRHMGV
jgi:glycosyltransferase involved in cell wall biosynthesis